MGEVGGEMKMEEIGGDEEEGEGTGLLVCGVKALEE